MTSTDLFIGVSLLVVSLGLFFYFTGKGFENWNKREQREDVVE